jgi:hypothetical protein
LAPQIRIHNHWIIKLIYTAPKRSSDLVDGELLKHLDAFVATNTDTKEITAYLSGRLGTSLTLTWDVLWPDGI